MITVLVLVLLLLIRGGGGRGTGGVLDVDNVVGMPAENTSYMELR